MGHTISLVDDTGILKPLADRNVSVTVVGVLQGLGSANPKNEECYSRSSHSTNDGRLLAVIRPTDAGIIDLNIEAEGCSSKTDRIEVH